MKRSISIGIRRESKNKWERRVPLTPAHVEKLVKDDHATVYVQPSTKRIFPDSAYKDVFSFFFLYTCF
jgi:alpha-aminoadipic semialdehyde synthase